MRAYIFLLFFICASFIASAQSHLVPLEYNPSLEAYYNQHRTARLTAVGDTLTLPFFEDFTGTNIIPDPAKWKNYGVYVGNNYAIDPPNYNVATFDGLRDNGRPYVTSNPLAVGPADSLVSLPIDLSFLVASKNVYFRFFFERGGIGELPDNSQDSLRLQFRNRAGQWNTVWMDSSDGSGFNFKLLTLADSSQYYYKGFQFRFQSFGRLSGSYDIWNLDYILMDTGRLAQQNWTPDQTFKSPPPSLLRNYTAMPIKQFNANPSAALNTNTSLDVINLHHLGRVYTTDQSQSHITDLISGSDLGQYVNIAGPLSPVLVQANPSSPFYYSNQNVNTPVLSSPTFTDPVPRILKYEVTLTGGGQNVGDSRKGQTYEFNSVSDTIVTDIDFTLNDRVYGENYLTDFYAYDDGSAEFGYGISGIYTKIASRFDLNQADSLTYIDLYFPLIRTDNTGESLTLLVWGQGTNGFPGSMVYNQTIGLTHATALNQFQRIILDKPQYITSKTIFVGFQINTSTKTIYLGFDANTDNLVRQFISIYDQWDTITDRGSFMIRPGFRNDLVTETVKAQPATEELQADIYPNPTQGTLNVAAKISTATLSDLSGRILYTATYDEHLSEIHSIDVSGFAEGIYLLHLENGQAKTVKRVIVSHSY